MELKLGSCRVVMEFGFPAMLCLLLLAARRELLLQTLAVCAVHECGHGLAMCLTGAGLGEIRLSGAGLQMRTRTAVLSRGALLGIYLSGPLVNLLLAAALHGTAPEPALLHLCMGVFNLLPFRVLDGGAALRLFADTRALSAGCALLAAAGIVALAVLHIPNPLLCLLLGYLAAAEYL